MRCVSTVTNRSCSCVVQGVADHSNLSAPAQPRADGLPPRPDTTVIDVCLLGVIYSAQLALHFFRQNTSKGGKFVSTSSMAGIYPSKPMPLYTAAKHGVSLLLLQVFIHNIWVRSKER